MLKLVAGVIVGYVVMSLLIFTTFSGAYLAIGADLAFQAGNYSPSVLWLVLSVVLGFFAAWVGGVVCARIGGNGRAPKALAGVVVVLGILMALPALTRTNDPRPTVRTGSVPNMEAMTNARQPVWMSMALPFLGAAGVLMGGREKRTGRG